MFNLQADARSIAKGIEADLDMDMRKLGIGISDFTIESFSYPEEIKKMQEKAAAQSMVGDMGKYTQMAAADGMTKGGRSGSGIASDMVGLQMGMAMGQQLVNQMNMGGNAGVQVQQGAQSGAGPKFCPNCGTPTTGSKFCGNCGNQLF